MPCGWRRSGGGARRSGAVELSRLRAGARNVAQPGGTVPADEEKTIAEAIPGRTERE